MEEGDKDGATNAAAEEGEKAAAARHGVHIPRQTLSRWVALAADTLEPLNKLMSQGQQKHS